MANVSVTQKGQVTIPISVRRALGIVTGSKSRFSAEGHGARLELVKTKAPSRVEAGAGLLHARGKSLAVSEMDPARLLRRAGRK